MIYIRINLMEKKHQDKKRETMILSILKSIIPKANPDYDDVIPKVNQWYLEFENESSLPSKEIGIDSNGIPILKMPYKNNYGYWIDNNLDYQYFSAKFDTAAITKETFLQAWQKVT